MDKTTAKLMLASFRHGDAADPLFAEALEMVATDPELADWFEEMQRFDSIVFEKVRDVQDTPSNLKSHILLNQHAAPTRISPLRHWGRKLALPMAALFVFGFLSILFFTPRQNQLNDLEEEAISFTGKMPALQFVCFNASAVAEWINEQPGTQKVGLKIPPPGKAMSMVMIGSSVVEWSGQPVVMVCLQNGRRMAMLYILKPEGAPDLAEGASRTVQKDGWVVQTTKISGQLRVLAARGKAEDLNFQTPL